MIFYVIIKSERNYERIIMEKKYEIVSLGQNCLPRTILTRWGIKPSKAQGELSCPFDLVKHELDRIIYYIENDFEGYFDDLYFKLCKKNFFDFRGRGVWIKNDGTIFFHDKDCKKDDKEKLIQRISRRIDNFREIIKSDKPILFVMNVMNYANDPNINMKLVRLYNILKHIRGDKFFKIALFDFNYEINDSDKYYVLRLPKPIEKYDNYWNRSAFVKSVLGRFFENSICEFIKYIIKKDFEQ